MSIPKTSAIEIPILQELVATGGTDDVRFIYVRLLDYFPQIDETETSDIRKGKNENWRKIVQKAGKLLSEKNLIVRQRGLWAITDKGKIEAELESSGFTLSKPQASQKTHTDIQAMLLEIGSGLGFYTAKEFEYYDVVWRDTETSQRLSHVFEVQSRGNLDSAFAKLKRAYEAQRTKPFLILSSETDLRRARQSLTREFQDLQKVLVIVTFAQIEEIHLNIQNIGEIIREFLLK
jgi:hypothetical protein